MLSMALVLSLTWVIVLAAHGVRFDIEGLVMRS